MMCKRQGNGDQVRILVADWDQANARALAAVMRTAGFKVATVCDGLEAVAEANHFKPELLITEPYLGRLSGIHAAVAITSALPDCRVLFLSGEASMKDIAKAAPPELVYSFAFKPIHPLDLLNAVAYLASAEWSSSDSATAGSNPNPHNQAPEDQPQPGNSSPHNLNGRQDSEPASLALDSSTRYFRALLALKREHPGRHKTNRHQHTPVCK
jgi:CheY-like chemotaxis protein